MVSVFHFGCLGWDINHANRTTHQRKTETAHYHYDLRFLMQSGTWDSIVSEESNQIAWVKLAEVSDVVADESVLRMVRKSLPG